MVQTVKSRRLQPGQQKVFLERPHVLSRIFFKITTTISSTANYMSAISFDDPLFFNYYTLLGSSTYFQAKGNDIFQGDIWLRNDAAEFQYYTSSEILH